MSHRTRLLAVLLLILHSLPVRSADEIPDLIPADALGAFGIRSVNDLRKKGDKFLADAGFNRNEWRISQLVPVVYTFVGIKSGIDENGRVLLVGVKSDDQPNGDAVLVVPFDNLDAMADNFGFKKGALKRDTATALVNSNNFFEHCYVRGNHLFLGRGARTVELAAKAKSVGPLLNAPQRKTLDRADLVLHLGTNAWGNDWNNTLKNVEDSLHPADERERKVAAQLLKTLASVRFLVASAHIDEGLGLRFLTVFPKELPPEVVAFLTTLQAGPGSSNLRGLPSGNVLVAHAARTDGAENATLAKLLIRDVFRSGVSTENVFSAADQPLVTGVFADLWRSFKGRRLALYRNADETRHGLFSLAAIFDADDPKKVLDEIGALARLAEGKDLDLSDKTGKSDDIKAVQKLVRDLGDDDFTTREDATTKLNLIGEPALPFLEKTAESDDAEVRARGKALAAEIRERAALRRKELLNAQAPKLLRPGFVLTPAAESLDGQNVDVLHVKLGKEDAGAVAQMSQLLGPDWARIRLATVGKKIVVLIGSDVDLFKKTIANVKGDSAGLAEDRSLAAFHKQADRDRKFELHVALQALEALTAPEGLDPRKLKAGTTLTSLAVAVDKGRFEINLYVPAEQFGAVMTGSRLFR